MRVLAVGLALGSTLFWRGVADPFAVVEVASITVGACTAGGLALLAARRAPATPTPIVLVPVLALVGVMTLASALGRSPITSLLGGYGRYDGLLSWILSLIVVLVVVIAAWPRPEVVSVLGWAATIAGGLGAAYLLIQAAGLDPYEWLDGWGNPATRPTGLLGNPNLSGALLAMAVPLTVGLTRQRVLTDRRGTPWLLGTAVAMTAGCVVSQSTGAVLALLMGLGLSSWLTPWGPRPLGPPLVALASVGAIASLALVVGSADDPPTRRPETLTTAGWANGDPDADIEGLHASPLASLRTRGAIWVATTGVVTDAPLLGVGPGQLLSSFPAHRNEALGGSDELRIDNAHNLPLQVAATGGVAALTAVAAVVATAVWTIRRGLDPVGDDPAVGDAGGSGTRAPLVAFTASLAAFATQALFDVDAVALWTWAAACLGAIAVLGDPRAAAARGPNAAVAPPTRQDATAMGVVGCVVAVAIAAGAWRLLAADRAYRQALDTHATTGLPQVAAVRMQDAIDLRPTEPVYRSEHARLVAALPEHRAVPDRIAIQRHRTALADLEVARELLPDDPYLLHELARTWWALKRVGDPDAPEQVAAAFERAAAADPNNWTVRADQGEQLLEDVEGGFPESLPGARAALTRADELRPDDPRLYALLRRLDAVRVP
jgi:hypothetical protein